jgi:hypothetical protein
LRGSSYEQQFVRSPRERRERVVLLGIEHLEQGRRRITTEIGTHLVDLVEQERSACMPSIRSGGGM